MSNAQAIIIESVNIFNYFESENISFAKELFNEYKEKNVILEGDFDDNKWLCSDEYSHTGINFTFNEVSYKKYYEELLNIPIDSFRICVKVFIIFSFGKVVLKTLQTIVNDLKRIIKTNPDEIYGLNDHINISRPAQCIDFFSNLAQEQNEQNIEHLIDTIEAFSEINNVENENNKRSLAQFESYFLFNDIMNDYWNSDISREERLFYYPLYLWWQVTGVIPLRPREFILTSRNCLSKEKDEYYLTLRRNKLKGNSSTKKVIYRIEEDYYDTEYIIPRKLGETIQQYLDFTSDINESELKTLFVTDTHYKHWNRKKGKNNRYFTYVNLNCVLRYFYQDIIYGKYHMTVIYENSNMHLNEGEISYLHLGDTRHLALINIMAEGGTPILAMQLAGHANIDMAAHYYSNITSLIECRTYRQYQKISKGDITYKVSRFNQTALSLHKEFTSLPDNARCYSEEYKNGSIKDCINSTGKNGEIGNCSDCIFYRCSSKNISFYENDKYYKEKIQQDCKYLEEMVRLVRLEKGNIEDIGSALLRLRTSSYNYEKYCKEKLLNQHDGGKLSG